MEIVECLCPWIAEQFPAGTTDPDAEIGIFQAVADVTTVKISHLLEHLSSGQHRPSSDHVNLDWFGELSPVPFHPSDWQKDVLPIADVASKILDERGVAFEIHYCPHNADIAAPYGHLNQFSDCLWLNLDIIVDMKDVIATRRDS